MAAYDNGLVLRSTMDAAVPMLDVSDTSVRPWYKSGFGGLRSGTSGPLSASDPANWGIPTTYDQGAVADPQSDSYLVSLASRAKFQVDVCAQSTDPGVMAIDIAGAYTRIATSYWRWNEVGDFEETGDRNWLPAAGNGIFVAPNNAWSSVTDGSRPPRLSGDTANQGLAAEGFV